MTEASINRIPDSDFLAGWREAARVAELGMKAAGATKALCQIAGYARSREGKHSIGFVSSRRPSVHTPTPWHISGEVCRHPRPVFVTCLATISTEGSRSPIRPWATRSSWRRPRPHGRQRRRTAQPASLMRLAALQSASQSARSENLRHQGPACYQTESPGSRGSLTLDTNEHVESELVGVGKAEVPFGVDHLVIGDARAVVAGCA